MAQTGTASDKIVTIKNTCIGLSAKNQILFKNI